MICDFAETYCIYDYKRLRATYAATLATGLGEDSRIKMKLRNEKVSIDRLMLATICDALIGAVSSIKKDKIELPSFIDFVTGREETNNKIEKHCSSYESGDDFETARRKIIGEEVN